MTSFLSILTICKARKQDRQMTGKDGFWERAQAVFPFASFAGGAFSLGGRRTLDPVKIPLPPSPRVYYAI